MEAYLDIDCALPLAQLGDTEQEKFDVQLSTLTVIAKLLAKLITLKQV